MVKHVMIDEGSNRVKEYQFTELEKQTKAYSKEELARFRQQFEAESIMEKVRGMVTQVMIQKADHHSRQVITPQMVQPQVNVVMNKSIDEILNFLAENGVKLPPPPPPPPPRRAPTPPAAGSPGSGEYKLRQMVQQKYLKETDLAGAALANKVDQVMALPRPKILMFLQSEIPPTPPPPPPPRAPSANSNLKRPYNWIKESNDHWEYLPPPVQEALKVLGYNETFWNKNEQPELSDKAYADLTPQQQKAIRILGCSPQEWDDEETPPPTASNNSAVDDNSSSATTPKKKISPEERAMMLKIKEMVTYKLRTELNLTGNEPSELLNKAVMEILNLPKEGVTEYLKRPLLPPHVAAQFQPPPPARLNWVWDSKAYWDALPPHIQDAAMVLGYDEDTWNNTEQPEESDMKWRHLSIRQQEAAITLGYTQEAWDEGDKDVFVKDSNSEETSDDDDDDDDVVGELDSDDDSEDFEEEEVAADGDDNESDDEDQFISYFIEGQEDSEDEDDAAEDLITNFISNDPNVVRELSKKDQKDEVLDDDSVDGTDIPFVSNSILRKDSESDDDDDDDDDEDFYNNFRSEGKDRSGDVLTEDETETTEERERDPGEQKFSKQLETFMSLWSFKL